MRVSIIHVKVENRISRIGCAGRIDYVWLCLLLVKTKKEWLRRNKIF